MPDYSFGGLANPTGGGGGFLSGLSNLFQNKLFLQLLSQMGQDLMSNKPGGVNAALQQNISSQNYMKMLSKMLAGDIMEGGKVTHEADKSTFVVPKLQDVAFGKSTPVNVGGASGGTGTLSSPGFTVPSVAPTIPILSPSQLPMGYPNPFVSSQPGFSASDLAGVSPEMISQALQFKMAKEEMGQKNMAQIMDMIFKGAQLESEASYRQVLTEESIIRGANMQQEIIEGTPVYTFPGTNVKLTRAEAVKYLSATPPDERTADIKNFQYARSSEGGGYTGSFKDFVDPQTTSDWKNYQLAGGLKGTGKSFDAWLTGHETSRAIKVGLPEKLGEIAATDLVKSRSGYFTGNWTAPIDKIDFDDPIASSLRSQYIAESKVAGSPMSYTDAKARSTLDAKLLAIRREIVSRGGKVIELKRSGNTYIHIVEWPDVVDQNGNVVFKAQTQEIPYVYK